MSETAVKYLGKWLPYIHSRSDIPALSVAVFNDGKIIFNEAYGLADVSGGKKNTVDTVFRIASHSKMFTATAIMQLQERGKLLIDEKAVEYLDWLKDHKDKRYKEITIRQLLSHGAGMIRDGADNDYWSLSYKFPDYEKFKSLILESDLVLDNNTKLKYSNFGYGLLGMVIEAVSGQSYEQFVTENIIDPLQLKNIGPEISDRATDRLATGYTRSSPDKKRIPIDSISTYALASATGFYSNAEDLGRFLDAQLIGSDKLLNDESKKEMQKVHWKSEGTNYSKDYGLGYEVEELEGAKLIGHGGGFPGFTSKSYMDTKNKTVVVVLTNTIDAWTSYLARSIIKILKHFEEHESGEAMHKYEGWYMSLFNDIDILALDDGLTVLWADQWDPLDEAEKLVRIDGDTFKIEKTGSYGSEGEKVEFFFDKDEVAYVIYAGERLTPGAKYWDNISKTKKISLK